MILGAAMLGMTRVVDFTDWINVPLAMDVDVSKVVTYEASFSVMGVGLRERGVNRYTMDCA